MKEQLIARSKAFAIAIIQMTESLPRRNATYIISNQIVKSSSSIGANYRAALRGRSKAEFIAKLGIVEEEADETLYWLEILREGGIASKEIIDPLWKECNELLSIFIATIKTTKSNRT
ncbi:four helix bundle protein [Algoriphagus sp. D3-2-R+10]|uniref:four helix bundle protein n=1 Tax=Algoriphagus aurantiacus TaxID=3103948 RepID=UPI002B3D5423|nr:four helix bundle protein [Algoriphagus sp. D3-2-R+10]MEB2777224.1 four helix bundle protein [Algoriphagus sp. D3-2-R+10]